jgi:hypothetical protein
MSVLLKQWATGIAGGQSWSTYWTTRGKLIITFDYGKAGIYTDAFPILVAQGVTATFYIVADYVGTAGYVTWAQLVEMQAAGMDIQCHTKDHVNLTTLTEAQIDTNLQAVNAAFVANGLTAPSHISYPGGQYDHDVKTFVADHRLTGRRTGYGVITGDMDRYGLPSQWIDNGYLNVTTMTTIKGYIDTANTNKTALCLYAHDCSVAGGELAISGANLNEIIDYAQGVPVDIMTISQLYAQMSHAPIVDVDSPVVMTLTSNGTGVSILVVTSSVDQTITLDGTARFYTDAAATLNESATMPLLAGVQNSKFIKCTSGVSNMTFSKNTLTKFSYSLQSANNPTLGGSLQSFPYLTYIYGNANCSVEIDMNEISRLLTDINWRTGTAKGSISQSPYGLTNLRIVANNAVSGNLSELREGLLSVEIGGKNVITGDIADMPSTVTYFLCSGSNTISGDIADAPAGITYLDIRGSNHLNTYTGGRIWSANVNFVRSWPATSYGLSIAEITALVTDLDNSAWTGSNRTLSVIGQNASMVDTNQGGIWGDFDGEATPSALATAYKSLIRAKSVTVELTGITAPGATGDGTGFPAGFGDWYRS